MMESHRDESNWIEYKYNIKLAEREAILGGHILDDRWRLSMPGFWPQIEGSLGAHNRGRFIFN